MGTFGWMQPGGNFRSLDDRRAAVVEAGANLIFSSKLDWENGITYDALEGASGVNRAQITRDFGSKAKLIRAVIGRCLDTDQSDIDDFFEQLTAAVTDRSLSLPDALMRVGDVEDGFLRNNRRVHAQMLLWSAAGDDAELAAQIRSFYRFYDAQKAAIVCREIEERFSVANLVSADPRRCERFMAMFTAMAEGLAIRSAIDPDSIPPGTTGLIYTHIVESYVTRYVGREEPLPPGEQMRDMGL